MYLHNNIELMFRIKSYEQKMKETTTKISKIQKLLNVAFGQIKINSRPNSNNSTSVKRKSD